MTPKRIVSQMGVSTVALAITVLAGAILVFGALAGYNYVSLAKIDNEILMLSSMRKNTIRLGQALGDLTSTNATIEILNKFSFFDDPTFKVVTSGSTTTVYNQWGGTVTVSAPGLLVAGDSLDITFTGVADDICYAIGSRVDSIAAKVTVGSTVTKSYGAVSNLTTLKTACGTAGSVKSITYTFLR